MVPVGECIIQGLEITVVLLLMLQMGILRPREMKKLCAFGEHLTVRGATPSLEPRVPLPWHEAVALRWSGLRRLPGEGRFGKMMSRRGEDRQGRGHPG